MSKTNEELVCVNLYIGLGDGDGEIEGHKILPKTVWDAEVERFETFLQSKELECVEGDSEWGCFEMNMENYTVIPCSKAEEKTIKKFFGNGFMKMPTEFLYEAHVGYDGPVWND